MTRASPLKNGYLVSNPILNAWLRFSDAMLKALTPRVARDDSTAPSSVLVSITGHRGDAIVATIFLESLQRSLPGVRIGVLTPEWNTPVFEGDGRVHALHVAHHWRLDRAPGSVIARLRRSRRARERALDEAREAKYDAAVELSPHYPSAARLFHAAGIPRRVGYPTGGGASLLTHVVPWVNGRSIAEDHAALLGAVVAPARPTHATGGYHLQPRPHSSASAVEHYALIHAGAGADLKIWPAEHWRAVAASLAADGTTVVLTGFGAGEEELNRRIGTGIEGVVDLTNTLDWDGMRDAIAKARVVLCADTVAMHLAAAHHTPAVAIMSGIWPVNRWRPPVESVQGITHPVTCSPCYTGCGHMSCIRGVTPEQVLAAARAHLSAPGAPSHSVPARL